MARKTNIATQGIGKTLHKLGKNEGRAIKHGAKALHKSVKGVGDVEANLLKNVHKRHHDKAKGIFGSGLGIK